MSDIEESIIMMKLSTHRFEIEQTKQKIIEHFEEKIKRLKELYKEKFKNNIQFGKILIKDIDTIFNKQKGGGE